MGCTCMICTYASLCRHHSCAAGYVRTGSAALLLMQVKVLIQSIRVACERPVDKIDRQQLRKQAHQLADYCKDGEWGAS
jgi:hypothetical protein